MLVHLQRFARAGDMHLTFVRAKGTVVATTAVHYKVQGLAGHKEAPERTKIHVLVKWIALGCCAGTVNLLVNSLSNTSTCAGI